jgi:hypothetical protein
MMDANPVAKEETVLATQDRLKNILTNVLGVEVNYSAILRTQAIQTHPVLGNMEVSRSVLDVNVLTVAMRTS